MVKILGLDISAVSTGYSVMNRGRLVKSVCGMIKPKPRRPYGERLQTLEAEIKKLIRDNNPDEVIIEDIFKGRNAKTFKILSMFRGVAIKAIYDEMEKDPLSVMASQARALLGIKNTKEDAFDFINSKYKLNYDFEEHNDITDSIVLSLTMHQIKKQGIDEKSLQNIGRRKKRKRRRNKKGV